MTLVTTQPEPTSGVNELPPLAGEEDGERVSVTDVNGTVARFEMAYTPDAEGRYAFGPPMKAKAPSFVYLGIAGLAALVVAVAYASPSGSALFRYVVEGDKHRFLSSPAFALILLASAIGTVIRAHMRGVIVTAQGLESRSLLMFGFPRVRAFAWPQVERLIVDPSYQVMLELWDGRYEKLPEVGDAMRMAALLQTIASNRHIRVTHLPKV